MSGKLSKFLALPSADKRVFLSAVMWLPLFWLGLRVFGLARLQAWIDHAPLAEKTSPSVTGLKGIGALVNSAARYTPGPVTCLTRSLLLRWLLRRRGIASELRIGVQLVQGRLDAHAWVEVEGVPLNDAPDVAQRFAAFNEPLSPGAFSSP
jgi:Transglutaminase-like superfamily